MRRDGSPLTRPSGRRVFGSFSDELAATQELHGLDNAPRTIMNAWESEAFFQETGMGQPTPATSQPASLAMPMDQDALLEALVFMDDLGLHDDGLMLHNASTIKSEMTLGFGDLSATNDCGISMTGSNSLIPDDAYIPGSMQPHGGHLGLHHGFVPVPASPPVSATSTSSSQPSSPSTVSETVSTNTAMTTENNKPKGVVNRSRNRRREELSYLRSMVSELEERLTTVRKRAEDHQEIQRSKMITGEPVEDDPVMAAVWEDMAQRQLTQRQRAEAENAKLRRMLEDQIQVGKSLERLLKKRSNAEDVELHLHGKRARRSSVSLSWNNAAIFGELLAHIPAMYEQTDDMFSKHSFTRNPANFRDIQVLNDPGTGMMLEVVEAHAFPFDYHLTAEHFWTLFTVQSEKDPYHYHDTDIEDNILKVQFGLTVQVARARGEFNLKVVSRRYTEADRTVIIWTGFSDPTEISDTNMDGIYMRHRGWTIIEPIQMVDPDSGGNKCVGARTRSYSTAIPEAFEDVPDQKRKVGTLTNFMLTTTDVQISSRLQLLENRLLELSLESSA